MLKLTGLVSGYHGSRVLSGASLELKAGESVAIVGRNGVGKSTLLKTAIGLLPAVAGHVQFDDTDLNRVPSHQRVRMGMGYIGQELDLVGSLSVRDNIAIASDTRSRRRGRALADAMLAEEFSVLAEKANLPAGTLSGGQQRLVCLARALVREPRVLMFDEPTEGVQPSVVLDLGERLRTIKEERGLGILLVEQRLDFAAAVADRILVMVKGRIERSFLPEELLADTDAQHTYLGV